MQGIGWWLAERNIAQISLNITDMDVTPMHVAYEEAKADAEKMNIAVTGSELVMIVEMKILVQLTRTGWAGATLRSAGGRRVLHQEGEADGA